MRYKKLSDLVRQLRAEARLSTSSSTGLEADEYLMQLLRRIYETLWDDYEWEHSRLTRADGLITLVDGTHLYDLPTDAYFEGIEAVWYKDTGGNWLPLDYGIGHSLMNIEDTDAGEESDPVRRWAPYDTGTKTQIEVWPKPGADATVIAVTGKRKPAVLKDGDSIVDLDDLVIVLMAAAEVLAESRPHEAKIKADAASARLLKVRAKASGKTRWSMGLGQVGMPRKFDGLNVKWNP
jgi:hypothetical protein